MCFSLNVSWLCVCVCSVFEFGPNEVLGKRHSATANVEPFRCVARSLRRCAMRLLAATLRRFAIRPYGAPGSAREL